MAEKPETKAIVKANPVEEEKAVQARIERRMNTLYPFLHGFFERRFNYSSHMPDDMPRQFFVLSNHEADWDPILMCATFKNRGIRFFMSEHLLRVPVLGAIARWIDAPIPVMRQVNDTHSVRKAMNIFKAGGSVGLFPAGEREWDGAPMPIADSIGKFAKVCKVPLVTFRIEGFYFVEPRWARKGRKLSTRGTIVHIYTLDELKTLSADELTARIRADLAVDSDAWRAALPDRTRGKHLAEWLEALLYVCPQCHQLGTLFSHDDVLECSCGFHVHYTDRDVFEEGAPFRTVHEWSTWQTEHYTAIVKKRLSEGGYCELHDDVDIALSRVTAARKGDPVAKGRFSLSNEELRCGDWSCAFDDIQGLGLVGRRKIIFTCDNVHYQLKGKNPWNIKKFGDLYAAIQAWKNEQTAAEVVDAEVGTDE